VPIALVLGTAPIGIALAPVMGASLGLLPDDLRERLMLGDTGANVIGAALGLAIVLGTNSWFRLLVMIVLLALNVAAERISFSDVIGRVGVLHAIDMWGRVRPPAGPPGQYPGPSGGPSTGPYAGPAPGPFPGQPPGRQSRFR